MLNNAAMADLRQYVSIIKLPQKSTDSKNVVICRVFHNIKCLDTYSINENIGELQVFKNTLKQNNKTLQKSISLENHPVQHRMKAYIDMYYITNISKIKKKKINSEYCPLTRFLNRNSRQ